MNDYEACYTTGIYEDQICEFCPYKNECSGYDEDEDNEE